jgi:DNA invertase Pin-like site-specific DNA recombinase
MLTEPHSRYKNVTPEMVFEKLTEFSKTNPAPASKRAAIYIRKSRMIKDETAYSPKEQERACREFAANEGLEIVEVIQDLDRSGRNSDREGFQRLLRMIKSGDIDYVLVQYLDREFRNGVSFIQFYDFIQNYGVQFLSVSEKLDTRSFTGRFMLFVLAVAAELPVWAASERVRKAKEERRKQGLHNGGYRLGYCNGLCSTCTDPNGGGGYCPWFGNTDRPESQRGRIQVPHPIEQHAVRLIAHEYEAGKSSREIASYINNTHFTLPDSDLVVKFRTKGVPGSYPPGEFSSSSILDIVRNPFYAGFVSHHPTPDLNMNDNIENPKSARVSIKNRRTPEEIYQGQHQALVSVELWQKNLMILNAKGNRVSHGQTREKKRTYLLAGIGRCAECKDLAAPGHAIHLRGTPNGSNKRIYRCANAVSKRIDSTPASDLRSLGMSSQPDPNKLSKVVRHRLGNLPAEMLENQVHELVKRISLPPEWYESILAYAASEDGPSEYQRNRYNLLRELERYKDLFKQGLLDMAGLKTAQERIVRELGLLDPRVDPRLKTLIPLLADFPALWDQMTPHEQHSLLKRMFEGLYFDGEGRLVDARAYTPFDQLMGLI